MPHQGESTLEPPSRIMKPYLTISRINSFFGIKYAAAPVGQLRWQPPVNIESSNNYSTIQMPLNASSNGPFCVQGNPAWQGKPPGGAGQSEDCLILDVKVPAKPTSKFLPVVVQIHGGGECPFRSTEMGCCELTPYQDMPLAMQLRFQLVML